MIERHDGTRCTDIREFHAGDRVYMDSPTLPYATHRKWGTVEKVGSTNLHVRVDGDWTWRNPDKLRIVKPGDVLLRNPTRPVWYETDRATILVDDGFVASVHESYTMATGNATAQIVVSLDNGKCHYGSAGSDPIAGTGTRDECIALAERLYHEWKEGSLTIPDRGETFDDAMKEFTDRIRPLLRNLADMERLAQPVLLGEDDEQEDEEYERQVREANEATLRQRSSGYPHYHLIVGGPNPDYPHPIAILISPQRFDMREALDDFLAEHGGETAMETLQAADYCFWDHSVAFVEWLQRERGCLMVPFDETNFWEQETTLWEDREPGWHTGDEDARE
jgi:hypothetical protein